MTTPDKSKGKALFWPRRVWLVQDTNGTTILDRWFLTRSHAKRAADLYSPGNDWKAVPFVRPEAP